MKTRFVQNLSHEIRTPLNAIIGYSQLIAMGGDDLSEEEKVEFMDYINGCSDLLTMLIEDVLNVSDIENGMLKIENTDANPT